MIPFLNPYVIIGILAGAIVTHGLVGWKAYSFGYAIAARSEKAACDKEIARMREAIAEQTRLIELQKEDWQRQIDIMVEEFSKRSAERAALEADLEQKVRDYEEQLAIRIADPTQPTVPLGRGCPLSRFDVDSLQ